MDRYFIKIDRDLPLHIETMRGILGQYPLKGGTHARCDRRIIHRGGGGSEAEASSRHSQKTSAKQRTHWIQDFAGMASQIVGPGKVYGKENQQTAGVNISFPVAHLRLDCDWNPRSSHRSNSRYLTVYSILLLLISLANPVCTDEMRQEVAVREEYPL